MISKHIEIVSSSKSYLSSMSRESREAARDLLSGHYSRVGITIVDDLSDLEDLVDMQPDLVFLGMKFIPVETDLKQNSPNKIWLSEYLDTYNIPYTGSNSSAHRLELNKYLAKQCVQSDGIKTANFHVVACGETPVADATLPSYPVFIKPANRGGGMGIDADSVAHNFEQLIAKTQSIATKYQSDSLIETYLSGREFSVAVMDDTVSGEFLAMPIELVAEPNEHGVRILSGAVKSSNAESVMTVTDPEVLHSVRRVAIDAFRSLGARDYGRIDIRLDEFGVPHFLEANLIPSLIADYGSFPKSCKINNSLEYESVILKIVNLAFMRKVSLKTNPSHTSVI